MTNPADKIPKAHGELYFDPPLAQWKELALRNRERLVKQTFWGQTAQKVRSILKLPTDQPLVLTGHQPVFFHPGLWAKCLAASTLAESIQGLACHKVTDTALGSEHPHFLPEVEENGKARRKKLEFFTSKDGKQQESTVPFAYLPAPEFTALERIFADAQVFCPDPVKARMLEMKDPLQKGLKKNATWNDLHLHSLRMLDELCGVSRSYFQASKIWTSEPFLQFAASWLSNLPDMTQAYNESLNEYRSRNGISHELTPAPNLKFENWWTEIPFWGVTKYKQRHSLWAKKEGAKLHLKMKGGEANITLNYDNLHQELGTMSLDLWPKAIPQTLFSRMYLCDFFVHGVGGGAYEQVGDILFDKVFHGTPPAFGVATGTWLVEPEESRVIDIMLSHEARIAVWSRGLENNPEYIVLKPEAWQRELPVFMHPAFKACQTDPALMKLAQEKQRLIPLLKDPAQREAASKAIKKVTLDIFEGCGPALKVLEQGLMDLEKVKQTREVLSFREYPFFAYPAEVFTGMKEQIQAAAHAG